jgi:pimeloyl-ACP methyl ester carboxylesterase
VVAVLLLISIATRLSIELASRELEALYPPPGQMVSVDGHKLMLYCVGSGSPTVVLEAGLGIGWEGWQTVIPPLAALTRVCVYDRAGYGWSEPGPRPRTALAAALELHHLLANGGIPGPYVLLAHSYGGYVARLYASRFPDTLAGLVLVDPACEDEVRATDWAQVDPSLRPQPRAYRSARFYARRFFPLSGLRRLLLLYCGESALPADLRGAPLSMGRRALIASSTAQLEAERQEYASLPESEAQARAAQFPRQVPLTVITALYLGSPSDPFWRRRPQPSSHRELQARLAASSARGRQIAAEHSGHSVQLDQPDLIVAAVRDVVEHSRVPTTRP